MDAVSPQAMLCAVLDDVAHPGGLSLTDELLAAAGLRADASIADLGCGVGFTLAHLRERADIAAVGLDLARPLLGAARRRAAALPLLCGDAGRLPFVANSLDALLAECSLSTLPDLNSALMEFHRVLKPGGRLLASDIYVREPGGATDADDPRRGPLTPGALVAALDRCCFRLEQWRDRSDTLKVFAARLILAGVPLAALGCDRRGTMGYCWYIARKI